MKVEKFVAQYKEYVYRWIQIENQRNLNYYYYEEDEFWSSLIEKFLKKDSLNTYNGEVKFLTWLQKVLNNHYIDGLRKRKPYTPIVLSVNENEKDLRVLAENSSKFKEWSEQNTEIDLDKIDELVNDISELKIRILMKLLMYNPLFTVFTKEEKDFLSRNAKMDVNKIDLELETIFKKHRKIRHKDIASLTGYSVGSIGQTYDRAVRKYVIKPYLRMSVNL